MKTFKQIFGIFAFPPMADSARYIILVWGQCFCNSCNVHCYKYTNCSRVKIYQCDHSNSQANANERARARASALERLAKKQHNKLSKQNGVSGVAATVAVADGVFFPFISILPFVLITYMKIRL